jgi:hypothetical protein
MNNSHLNMNIHMTDLATNNQSNSMFFKVNNNLNQVYS